MDVKVFNEKDDKKSEAENEKMKSLEKMNSQVSFVKTKMAGRHWTQPRKDVSSSALPGRDLPITTLRLCEVYPDAELNTRALYTSTISSLMDVSTTWGAQSTRYHVGELHHPLQLPRCSVTDVSSQLTSSIIYSGVEATSATRPSPPPATSPSSLSV